MDEAIARGCTLQSAITSKFYIAQDYHIQDMALHSIKLKYESINRVTEVVECFECEVFKVGDDIPGIKEIDVSMFTQQDSFVIKAFSSAKIGLLIGSFSLVLKTIFYLCFINSLL